MKIKKTEIIFWINNNNNIKFKQEIIHLLIQRVLRYLNNLFRNNKR